MEVYWEISSSVTLVQNSPMSPKETKLDRADF